MACGCLGGCGCAAASADQDATPNLHAVASRGGEAWCGDALPDEEGPAARRGVLIRPLPLRQASGRVGLRLLPGVALPLVGDALAPGAWLSWLHQASHPANGVIFPSSGRAPGDPDRRRSRKSDPRTETTEAAKAWVLFGYGSASFRVDLRWYRGYAADPGRWSAPDTVLAALWPDYRAALAASRVSLATLDRRIGCWDLGADSSPSRYAFWQGGDGAPRELFRHVLGLMVAYRALIRDGQSGTSHCDNLGAEVFKALCGEEVPRGDGLSCRVLFNLRGDGSATSGLTDRGCDYTEVDCGSVPKSWTVAGRWDDFAPVWERYGSKTRGFYFVLVDAVSGSAEGDKSIMKHGIIAFGSKHLVTLPSRRLAWDGVRADTALAMARVALDYLRDGGVDVGHRAAAHDCGRFVLGVMNDYAQLLIHELGHTLVGGGHCRWGCCFDLAAHQFKCWAEGALGLSTSAVSAPSLGFAQVADRVEGPDRCSSDRAADDCASACDGDDLFACWNVRRCYTSTPGEPNPWFTAFYSTPCERTSAEAVATFEAETDLEAGDPCVG